MKWRHTTRGTTIPSKIIAAGENSELIEDEENYTSSSSDGEDGDIDVVTDNWAKNIIEWKKILIKVLYKFT